MVSSPFSNIPEGFHILQSRGPFADLNGPFYRKLPNAGDTATVFGFLPLERHANSLGFVHGGMISTLLDGFMAQAIAESYKRKLVTLTLNIEFKHVIPIHRWVQADIELNEIEKNVISGVASLSSRNRTCATAKATFRLFNR
ncbi:PaaI family thioesterase [Hirschia litorea]|uniref:Acyl-coenzyme A thioesterase THEM4 n=1 Tax=Hirschia litorea TaxID=1199156 RepID=A0ABW2IHN5_9PROT